MAGRYDDRYRSEPYRGERGYGREERGVLDRAGDEVRSWFGDEEAERRRRFDEMERERERQRERPYGRDVGAGREYGPRRDRTWSERGYGYPGERGWESERWGGGERWTSDYRAEYPRVGPGSYGRPSRYGGEAEYGTRYGGGYTGRPGTEGYTRPYGGRSDVEWETRRRGGFSGRGPKGYQRPDARINEDVCDRLTDTPDIDASNIEVRVNNGEVTLAGAVPSREDKRRAEDMIEHISGVREVHNQLRVSRWPEEAPSGATPGATTATSGTVRR